MNFADFIDLLIELTGSGKLVWYRLSDYLFYNGRNRALVAWTQSLPIEQQGLSYYCEFGEIIICIDFVSPQSEDKYRLSYQYNPNAPFVIAFGPPVKELLNKLAVLIEENVFRQNPVKGQQILSKALLRLKEE